MTDGMERLREIVSGQRPGSGLIDMGTSLARLVADPATVEKVAEHLWHWDYTDALDKVRTIPWADCPDEQPKYRARAQAVLAFLAEEAVK